MTITITITSDDGYAGVATAATDTGIDTDELAQIAMLLNNAICGALCSYGLDIDAVRQIVRRGGDYE
jgi:hypothetical protein